MENKVSKKLKKHREKMGMTQGEYAKYVGIQRQTYVHLEQGVRHIGRQTIKSMCESGKIKEIGLNIEDLSY